MQKTQDAKLANELVNVEDFKVYELDKLFMSVIPIQWQELFSLLYEEIETAGQVLGRLVQKEGHELCPYPWNIFRCFTLTPWVEVKVVIIGQDPYYLAQGSVPSATGCCFECASGMPIRQSLQTIFNRLESTVEGFEFPDSGDLTKWACQGVLLLNASLTTTVGKANAHAAIWKFMTVRVMQFLAEKKKNVVYMLWGRFAQSLKSFINDSDNLILEASHPAARGKHNTFRKCDHFNEANLYLEQKGRKPIDWKL